MNGFDLDTAVATWRQFLRTERSFSEEDIDELECHVRDQIDELIEDGISLETAYRKAIKDVGTHLQLKQDYQKVYWKKLHAERKLVNELRWRGDMMKSYFKTAFRGMWKHKIYTFINITGLSLGILCCCLIILFTQYEFSYDRYHDNADRIVRIAEDLKTDEQMLYQASSSPPMGPAFVEDFPEVESMVRIRFTGRLFRYEDKLFQEDRLFYADSTLFDLFSFEMLQGNEQRALADPFSIVLTETMARKYFGQGDALGQVLVDEYGTAYTVTGVVAEVKDNSHFTFDGLISMVSRNAWDEGWETQWFANSHYTYLLLKEGTDVAQLEAKTPEFIERRIGDLQRRLGTGYENLPLIPLTEIHMSDHRARGFGSSGRRIYIYVFGAIAIFILAIACINFMNLTTARSSERAKEVGLRKVVGAHRSQLAVQFLSESVLMVSFAFLLAIGLCWLVLPGINNFIGRSMHIGDLTSSWSLLMMTALLFLVAFLAGGYPSLILSRFQPVRVLKSKFAVGKRGAVLRKSLVVFQFTISIILIVVTAVVMRQLDFLQEQHLGFSKEQVLVINYKGDNEVNSRAETIKQQFLSQSSVKAASTARNVPGTGFGNLYTNVEVAPGEIRNASLNYYFVDHDFINMYEIELVAGRGFSRDIQSDSLESMIINEAMLARFGWSSPEEALGKTFTTLERPMKVIGVVKDFNYQSLQAPIQPLGLFIVPGSSNFLSLRLSTEQVQQTMAELETTWRELVPQRPFDAFFLDENFNNQYDEVERFSTFFSVFSGLAIFIACLGLFGLTAFSTERRTKEIGVRKVLGASIGQILVLLSRDFLRLIVIAFLLAAPLAYLLSIRWLSEFPYQAGIDVATIAVAGLIALLIAGLTVSLLTIRAALANPANAMRYE